MPIRDLDARNSSLDNDYGTNRGPNAPDSHELALFVGDPLIPAADPSGEGGEEVVGGGYARVTILPAEWEPASEGQKTLAAPKQFPSTTDEWPDPVTHWGLYDPAAGVWWDCGPLEEALDVTGPGAGPLVTPIIFYDDDARNQIEE